MSGTAVFEELDLSKSDNTLAIRASIQLRASATGVVNALRLTSPLDVHDEIRFEQSDSLMPPVVVPLADDVEVAAGDVVRVDIETDRDGSWETFRCAAAVVCD
jgi:hypothetical protein